MFVDRLWICANLLFFMRKASATMDLVGASKLAQARNEASQQSWEKGKRLKKIALPTDIKEVCRILRSYGEPITLFGEDAADRRERLRAFIAALPEIPLEFQSSGVSSANGIASASEANTSTNDTSHREDEPMETIVQGEEALATARAAILNFSFQQAIERLERERIDRYLENKLESDEHSQSLPLKSEPEQAPAQEPDVIQSGWMEARQERLRLQSAFKSIELEASHVGDARPLSAIACCQQGFDSQVVLTGSYGGALKAWSAESGSPLLAYDAATAAGEGLQDGERICSIAVRHNHFLTGSSTGTVALYQADCPRVKSSWQPGGVGECRIATVAWHPTGDYCAASMWDGSWNLSALQTGQVLWRQMTHSLPCFGVAIHPDGSLLGSSSLDGWITLWDLRSGQRIFQVLAHAAGTLGIDFAPNGYELAAGGSDHLISIWNLRKMSKFYGIAAHNSAISRVRYSRDLSHVLVSCSHDKTLKVWQQTDYSHLATLIGHEQRILDVAMVEDNTGGIVSAAADRTWKAWVCAPSPESIGDNTMATD